MLKLECFCITICSDHFHQKQTKIKNVFSDMIRVKFGNYLNGEISDSDTQLRKVSNPITNLDRP